MGIQWWSKQKIMRERGHKDVEANINEQSVEKDERIVTIKWITIILGQRWSSETVSKLIGVEGRYWLTLLICHKEIGPQGKIFKGTLEKEVLLDTRHQKNTSYQEIFHSKRQALISLIIVDIFETHPVKLSGL